MEKTKKATIIVHSGYFDKVMSAFIIGNGFLAIGVDVSLFFTFHGLNALKKGRMNRLPLSRMNMFGLGRMMIKNRLKKHNVASMEELAFHFKKMGGKIIACSMTMELMKIGKEKLNTTLIDEYATVGRYCVDAIESEINIFI